MHCARDQTYRWCSSGDSQEAGLRSAARMQAARVPAAADVHEKGYVFECLAQRQRLVEYPPLRNHRCLTGGHMAGRLRRRLRQSDADRRNVRHRLDRHEPVREGVSERRVGKHRDRELSEHLLHDVHDDGRATVSQRLLPGPGQHAVSHGSGADAGERDADVGRALHGVCSSRARPLPSTACPARESRRRRPPTWARSVT